MAHCNLCKKKISFWEMLFDSYSKKDDFYCSNCWKNRQEEILKDEELERFKKFKLEEEKDGRRAAENTHLLKNNKEIKYLYDKRNYYSKQATQQGWLNLVTLVILGLIIGYSYMGNGFFVISFEFLLFFVLFIIEVVRGFFLRNKLGEIEFEIKQKGFGYLII